MKANKYMQCLACVFLLIATGALLLIYFYPWKDKPVSDKLLSVINPGMTIKEVQAILGNSNAGTCNIDCVTINSLQNKIWMSASHGLKVLVPEEANPFSKGTSFWVSDQQRLLWVESQNEKITRIWLLPLVRIEDDIPWQPCAN